MPEHYLCTPFEKWPVGQGVKTPPFHGGITSSNLVRATRKAGHQDRLFLCGYGDKLVKRPKVVRKCSALPANHQAPQAEFP